MPDAGRCSVRTTDPAATRGRHLTQCGSLLNWRPPQIRDGHSQRRSVARISAAVCSSGLSRDRSGLSGANRGGLDECVYCDLVDITHGSGAETVVRSSQRAAVRSLPFTRVQTVVRSSPLPWYTGARTCTDREKERGSLRGQCSSTQRAASDGAQASPLRRIVTTTAAARAG